MRPQPRAGFPLHSEAPITNIVIITTIIITIIIITIIIVILGKWKLL